MARGELVEIGDGFRIPELLESLGARLREVGTTNRVRLSDYERAVDDQTAFVLKVHPSNFVVAGSPPRCRSSALAALPVPVVADIGSGLLAPHPRLPASRAPPRRCAPARRWSPPPATSCSAARSAGSSWAAPRWSSALRRHPFARALRVDKLTLAALEATLTGPPPPVRRRTRPATGRAAGPGARHRRLPGRQRAGRRRPSAAAVGGGGAPEVELPSAAVRLPPRLAVPLRAGDPPVVGYVEHGRLLLDLMAVRPPRRDWRAVGAAATGGSARARVATAGHVDHGKSTLVRALTGSDPDRLAEEHERGLSIELGYCWTSLPGVGDVAFVDVPGHERFIAPCSPGSARCRRSCWWSPPTTRGCRRRPSTSPRCDALGVRHGVAAVTRCRPRRPGADDAPGPAGGGRDPLATRPSSRSAPHRRRVSTTSASTWPTWSARCPRRIPAPTSGCGSTAASTSAARARWSPGRCPRDGLGGGRSPRRGDRSSRVRGVQCLGRPVDSVPAWPASRSTSPARTARSWTAERARRPERLVVHDVVDVRLQGDARPPPAAVAAPRGDGRPSAHLRPLGDDPARLTLDHAAAAADRRPRPAARPRQPAPLGLTVLDPAPPALTPGAARPGPRLRCGHRGAGRRPPSSSGGAPARSHAAQMAPGSACRTPPLPRDGVVVGAVSPEGRPAGQAVVRPWSRSRRLAAPWTTGCR